MDYKPLVSASKGAVTLIVSALVGIIVNFGLRSLHLNLPPEMADQIIATASTSIAAALWVGLKNVVKNGLGVELSKYL